RHSLEGRPAALGGQPLTGDLPPRLHVDDREVGVVADRQAALAGELVDPSGPVGGQVDEAFQRQAPRVDVIEHQGHQRLYARHARRCTWVGALLLLDRVWRMVGADDVEYALTYALPKRLAMAG